MKILKLSLVIVLILSVLIGCKVKDEEAPVITNVQVKDNIVKIEATDNVGVTGYISVSYPRQPSLTDERWQTNNVQTITEDGVYYIWVKDSSDNLTQYTETIEMSYNLALKFDHLNWLTPAVGTRVVDGVTYNLAELKAEYGDLYRLVEPLTKEEVERRFLYLAKFIEKQMIEAVKLNDYYWYPESGLRMNNDVNAIISPKISSLYEETLESEDSKLISFKEIYFYSSSTGKYEFTSPLTFTSTENNWRLSTDILDDIPFEDKNIFLRDITMRYEIQLNMYKHLNLEPEYVIENWD